MPLHNLMAFTLFSIHAVQLTEEVTGVASNGLDDRLNFQQDYDFVSSSLYPHRSGTTWFPACQMIKASSTGINFGVLVNLLYLPVYVITHIEENNYSASSVHLGFLVDRLALPPSYICRCFSFLWQLFFYH
jgi:hypothetical protein